MKSISWFLLSAQNDVAVAAVWFLLSAQNDVAVAAVWFLLSAQTDVAVAAVTHSTTALFKIFIYRSFMITFPPFSETYSLTTTRKILLFWGPKNQ
jgi:hypothetical protein